MLPPKETIDSTFRRLSSVGPWLLYLRCTKGAFWSMVDTCDYRDGWSEGACSMAPLLTTAKGKLWLMLGGCVGSSGGVSGTGWLLESFTSNGKTSLSKSMRMSLWFNWLLGTSPWCLFFRAVRSATILVSCLICSFRSSIRSGNSVCTATFDFSRTSRLSHWMDALLVVLMRYCLNWACFSSCSLMNSFDICNYKFKNVWAV